MKHILSILAIALAFNTSAQGYDFTEVRVLMQKHDSIQNVIDVIKDNQKDRVMRRELVRHNQSKMTFLRKEASNLVKLEVRRVLRQSTHQGQVEIAQSASFDKLVSIYGYPTSQYISPNNETVYTWSMGSSTRGVSVHWGAGISTGGANTVGKSVVAVFEDGKNKNVHFNNVSLGDSEYSGAYKRKVDSTTDFYLGILVHQREGAKAGAAGVGFFVVVAIFFTQVIAAVGSGN